MQRPRSGRPLHQCWVRVPMVVQATRIPEHNVALLPRSVFRGIH
ncbi:hypothetical protein LINPERPRIM_LOCUS11339 [Linum perenne]